MAFKTIVTLGPSIIDKDKLKRIDACGECIYRINGAHIDADQVPNMMARTRAILPNAKIMIDLPGNKIRTAKLSEPIRLIRDESFILYDYQTNYPGFCGCLNKGDIVRANDSIFTLEVMEADKLSAKMLSHSDGLLHSNKGLHIKGVHKDIPFLFEKDRRLMDIADNHDVDYLSLSYVRTAADVQEVKRALAKKDLHLIAKVETQAAIDNLQDIFKEVESILVDRGDLSMDIDLIDLAFAQERIVKAALDADKNVYLATQFLKNMERNPIPLISEVIDLCRTVRSGIGGIQLSEETAVGRYPLESVKMVFDAFKNSRGKD